MKTLTQMNRWNLAICLGLTTALLMGCGDKKDDKKDDKKEAKTKSMGEKLIGDWEVDVETTVAKLKETAKTDDEKKDIDMSKGILEGMKLGLSFKDDGTASMTIAGEEPDVGKYEATDNGDHLVIKITEAKNPPPADPKVTFVNDDLICMEVVGPGGPSPMDKMFLKRVK